MITNIKMDKNEKEKEMIRLDAKTIELQNKIQAQKLLLETKQVELSTIKEDNKKLRNNLEE